MVRRWPRAAFAAAILLCAGACADVWGFRDLGSGSGSGGSSGNGSGATACQTVAGNPTPGTACEQCISGSYAAGAPCASAYDAFEASCKSCSTCGASADTCACYSDPSRCSNTQCGALMDALASCLVSACGSSCPWGSSSSSGGSSGGSSSGSSSGSTGGLDCYLGVGLGEGPGNGDACGCDPATSSFPANSTKCSTSTLQDPGRCCANPGFPSTGDCVCRAFLCLDTGNGTTTCRFGDRDQGITETTSATGATCCVYSDSTLITTPYLCGCSSDPNYCSAVGGQPVSSCTIDAIAACGDDRTQNYSQVSSCSAGSGG